MKRATKFLAVTLIAFLSIFFMACNGELPADVLAAAKTELDIEYTTGDSTLSVTGDITLPAALEEYEGLVITWSSNNTAAIQNDGSVTRSAADVSVTITATLTYEEVTETKNFTVVVKADPTLAVAAAKTALAITYATGDSLTSVTGNLTLPAFVGDVDVTWASGTPAVITDAGVVTRGAADVTVTMTATLTMGTTSDTKTFDVVVKANPTLAVAAAKGALAITYATGDSATSVSDDVTLPTTLNGVAIAWASDKPAIVSATGNVSRTLDEETVVLTATLTMGTVSDTKTFTLTVLADTRLGVAMDALEDHYAATLGDPEYTVIANIDLIATIEGATVTWESKNTTYVSHTGVITRPSFTQGSQNVELVATVSIGGFEDTVSFFAYLEKLPKTDLELSDEILTRAMAFPAAEGIASDLTLVATAKDDDGNDYPITWASDNPAVIALDGTVTQDVDLDITVTLTATVTLNEVPYTRAKTFKVFKESTALVVDSIANAWKEDMGTYVKIMNLTVLAVYGTGNYVVTDGTGVTAVYAVDDSFTVTIGSVYNITGVVDLYYGAPELKGDVTAKPFVFELVTDATPENAPHMVGTVEEVLADQPTGTISNSNPMIYKYYTVTGKVFVSQTLEDNYNTYIVSDDFTGTPNQDTSIMIYYQSAIDVIRGFDGKEVTLELMMLGYRSDKYVWYANFYGTADDIDAVELTGQAALDADVAWLTLVDEVESGEELTLTAVAPYASTIAWSVVSGADAGIIVGNVVTFPTFKVDTDVVIKATLTQPELTAIEKSFTITVKREVIPVLPGQELYFSEYIEGGSNNKALEIFNPSSVTVDLSTYTVEVYSNGSETAGNTIALTGFLAPGEVFVIGNPSETGVDPVIVAESDVTSTVTYFNGDDALVLKNGTLIIDSIGKIGEDPTTGYWGGASGNTADWTMVRKATVRGGRTDA
ncbi:MAG: lamin tail domain-containing protein, partial [Candidatus Izemoplasmatales bacterium]|nr:lamin tail domain-containing protein [Candidatus Izemoplasmatales bacterium]